MKNTNYAIIDHVGSLESSEIMKVVYKMAYDISDKKETYTMKNFCKLISKNPNTRVSDKQKNFVRFNKHPQEVILICSVFNTTAQWTAETWAERTEKLTVIEAETMDVFDLRELHPEWFATKYAAEDSIYRRCANIWSRALGWSFSAPLYRDYKINATECYIRNTTVLKDKHSKIRIEDLSKVSTRPDSYLKAQTIAPEEECKAFFEYYKYLQTNNLLADSLEAGYELCPDCGRPIYESAEDCDWCTYHREAPLNYTTYYDDSYIDEDWD